MEAVISKRAPMSLRKTIYLMSGTLRGAFLVIMLLYVVGTILYTQKLVGELRKESRAIIEFYAQTMEKIWQTENMEIWDWFLVNDILAKINFPMISIDKDGDIATWRAVGVPENDRSPQAKAKVRKILEQLRDQNEPVHVKYGDMVLQSFYYGDSRLITRLEYLPYVTLTGLGVLILAAFLGFSNIKQSEQRFIWVGMAKETAHQLGTPISSLLGWLELLKSDTMEPGRVPKLALDMEQDVQRLEKIAARFSQIGSTANLEPQDLQAVLRDVAAYFRKRLPQAGREIKLVEDYVPLPPVALNRELFEWAVENLIKNAIDAVQGKRGVIEIIAGLLPDGKHLFIDFRDNGCGITAKRRHDIFKAGFSTKKRGWGLGLNFAKRIVEEYHGGKLYIKETHQGKGTTMRIVL